MANYIWWPCVRWYAVWPTQTWSHIKSSDGIKSVSSPQTTASATAPCDVQPHIYRTIFLCFYLRARASTLARQTDRLSASRQPLVRVAIIARALASSESFVCFESYHSYCADRTQIIFTSNQSSDPDRGAAGSFTPRPFGAKCVRTGQCSANWRPFKLADDYRIIVLKAQYNVPDSRNCRLRAAYWPARGLSLRRR